MGHTGSGYEKVTQRATDKSETIMNNHHDDTGVPTRKDNSVHYNDTVILNALPATWQELWGEPLTTRCAGCGERQTFTDLCAVTAALLRPCRSCMREHLDAFDLKENQMSVRCGKHGSSISVLACRCVVNFFVKDGDIGSALHLPNTDAPVTCASCKVERQATGSMDLDHTALICLFCLMAIIRKAQRCGIPIFVLDDDGTRLRWSDAGTTDGTGLMQGKETADIDVREVVEIHGVIPDDPGEPFDYHTHGLTQFGHAEFQALAPGYCRAAIVTLLRNHADQVINADEKFVSGDVVNIDGIVCGYEAVPGDVGDDQPRLRIVDVAGGCKCQICEATDRKEDGDK